MIKRKGEKRIWRNSSEPVIYVKTVSEVLGLKEITAN